MGGMGRAARRSTRNESWRSSRDRIRNGQPGVPPLDALWRQPVGPASPLAEASPARCPVNLIELVTQRVGHFTDV
jgi:hypothetical protein